ncbi:hypothetical protein I3843_16G042000 [Carya illinoinensis]|uniref:C2H2-type domain-containing protein n=1 Tax=Carya illinoinensis TaxID=32201 RepID=A0A8T1N1T4_CARIL|nr:uncharacterized protein LOC122299630 [Carya illinoinensis]KAG2663613.1 hypothetical protein I3760_16G040900 [Carya illinoinensis]KAG2663614.1 hypothetical protein I3760_16G040900 [Carya illinoinensis]KAG6624602.1 hypothetical protein CIPAW_16G039800 [Carya illinoinensis]KAG6624603.1 hypothetical protein CIPAW_16G039800 [Carya illinoinensis]KAG6624604.1 hypothetical protein CIPAW_16G039800 [Carya illinoinensis]
MNLLVTAIDNLPSLFLHRPTFPSSQSPFRSFPIVSIPSSSQSIALRLSRIRSFASNGVVSLAASEIDMVKNRHGVYTPKQKKVVVLWDLDNKPPKGPPYQAAMALKQVAQRFGDVIDFSAYANRHAFIHLPQWVLEQRRERKQLDILERKGLAIPSEPYICGVCGRKCKTNLDLKKHFKQLHERERQKKLNRMRSLKGKKRQRYKERFVSGNHKYNEAERSLITPKLGYGLASELRRAGVFVKTVEDKPQAADWAVKRQMQHSMSRGVDWLFLVSDDSDFSEMLRRARDANLGTVVVGDWDRALGRHADLWVPWIQVENGEVSEEDLVPKSQRRREEDELFSVTSLDDNVANESHFLDDVVDELVAARTSINGVKISAFSEVEEEAERGGEWETEEENVENLFWDSEDEEDEYY